mmetsp:Transcript_10126/g.28664  ORF Transcript_10126/g.28664 Transcript_10126/m.28664 type:complete len:229 (-) Transcript_10126:408-1094(-)
MLCRYALQGLGSVAFVQKEPAERQEVALVKEFALQSGEEQEDFVVNAHVHPSQLNQSLVQRENASPFSFTGVCGQGAAVGPQKRSDAEDFSAGGASPQHRSGRSTNAYLDGIPSHIQSVKSLLHLAASGPALHAKVKTVHEDLAPVALALVLPRLHKRDLQAPEVQAHSLEALLPLRTAPLLTAEVLTRVAIEAEGHQPSRRVVVCGDHNTKLCFAAAFGQPLVRPGV